MEYVVPIRFRCRDARVQVLERTSPVATRHQLQETCRVLLIYHGAYLEPSRRMFEALSKQKDIRLRDLAPRRGYNRAREQVVEITRPYCGEYELVTGRVYKAMRDYSGPYIGGLLRECGDSDLM